MKTKRETMTKAQIKSRVKLLKKHLLECQKECEELLKETEKRYQELDDKMPATQECDTPTSLMLEWVDNAGVRLDETLSLLNDIKKRINNLIDYEVEV